MPTIDGSAARPAGSQPYSQLHPLAPAQPQGRENRRRLKIRAMQWVLRLEE